MAWWFPVDGLLMTCRSDVLSLRVKRLVFYLPTLQTQAGVWKSNWAMGDLHIITRDKDSVS